MKKYEEMQINGRVIYFKALDKDMAIDKFIEVLEEGGMFLCGNIDFKNCSFTDKEKKGNTIRRYSEMDVDGKISTNGFLDEEEFWNGFMGALETNNLFYGGSHTFENCQYIEA